MGFAKVEVQPDPEVERQQREWAMERLLKKHMPEGRLGYKGCDRWVIRALLEAKEEGRQEGHKQGVADCKKALEEMS